MFISDSIAPTSPSSRRERTAELLDEAARSRGKARRALQDQVIELNMDVARETAARYRSRGIPQADLEQVAMLALVKAVRRFDPDKATDFLSFAVPTMRGEVRRHFRDCGWMVRPPRSVQELQTAVAGADSDLSQELGRPPEANELAERLCVDPDQVRGAQAARGCFSPTSLDAVRSDDDESLYARKLATEEHGFSRAEARVMLGSVMDELSSRDRTILELRFFRGLTQAEIGERIGVTQMQVSRLLAGIMARLRSRLQPAA